MREDLSINMNEIPLWHFGEYFERCKKMISIAHVSLLYLKEIHFNNFQVNSLICCLKRYRYVCEYMHEK